MKNYVIKQIQRCNLKLLLLLCVYLLAPPSFAQQDDLRSSLNEMFSEVNLEQVPTGLLRDYAIEDENLDNFSGEKLSDKNVCTILQYANIINTLNSAAISEHTKKELASVSNLLETKRSNDNIDISLAIYKYSQIKADALDSGLFLLKNNKLMRTEKVGNPYQQSYVFAASCLSEPKEETVTLKIPDKLLFTNCPIKQLEIDRGNGYEPIKVNEPFKVNIRTSKNLLVFRATLSDGTILLAHTRMNTLDKKSIRTRTLALQIDSTKEVRIDKIMHISGKDYGGVGTSATVFVHFANGKSFQSPVVYVEGFDPHVFSGYPNGLVTINSLHSFIQKFDSKNMDVVYVDWDHSEEYIQANANTLIEVLKWLNEEKRNSKCSVQTIVMGHSMGGLVARYALKKMENENIKHDVDTYISYDTPHLGANVPIGVLYAYYGIKKFLRDKKLLNKLASKYAHIDEYLKLGDAMAFSTSAQQMLFYSVDGTGSLNNQEHLMWQSELNALGFPKGDNGKTMRLLAVANGGYQKPEIPEKYLDVDFALCSDILNPILDIVVAVTLNDIVAGLMSVLPGKSSVSGDFDVYPALYIGQQVTHIKIKYKKDFLWTIPISKTEFAYDAYAPNGYLPDTYPSSFYPTNFAYSGDYNLSIVLQYSAGVKACSSIPFIPSSSALAFGNGISTPAAYFLSSPKGEDSPFGENYYIETFPHKHTTPTLNGMDWIMKEIDCEIVGPSVGFDGAKYALQGITDGDIQNLNVRSWTTSNEKIATINQEGVLSIHGKGIISIIAKSGKETYSKIILVGMPRFVLKASHEPNGFKITADCIDEEYKSNLSDLQGILNYQFARKSPGQSMKWTESLRPSAFFTLDTDSTKNTFLFRAIDSQGNQSPLQATEVNAEKIYNAFNNSLYLDANGNLYKSNKAKYSYKPGRVFFEYKEHLDPKYKERKWMNTSTIVLSPYRENEVIDSQDGGPLIRDIVTQQELDYISQNSDEGQIHRYVLILCNYRDEYIQFVPFTITFKRSIK